MKINGWKEAAIRYALEKSIITDEQDINDEEIIARIITARSTILTQTLNTSIGWISPANYSKFIIEYDESAQYSKEFKVYNVPVFVNGIVSWLGASDFKGNGWRQRHEATKNSALLLSIPKVTTPYTIQGNELRVYNPNVATDVGVIAVVENPLILPSFNRDLDDFPLDNNLAGVMNEFLYKTYFQYVSGKKLDKTNDNVENPTA